MRVFVSINWSEEVISSLEAWQTKLRESGVHGYWRAKNNLHLTLKFLGEVPGERIADIAAAMNKAAAGVDPFEVTLRELGVFPNRRQPRILWIGVKSGPLLSLQDALERELETMGFEREHRDYRPHITLASGGINGLSPAGWELGRQITVTEHVEAIELMESVVDREGRRYVPIVFTKLG